MDRKRTNWDPASTTLFLDLCIAEKEKKLNWNNQGLTKDGWRNVQRSFKEHGGGRFTPGQMSNKLRTLKKRFMAWKALQMRSGLGRNKTTGAIEAEEELLEAEDGTEDAIETEDTPEELTRLVHHLLT